MEEFRTNGHVSNNNMKEPEILGKEPGWLQQQGLTITSESVAARLLSTQCTITKASPNPITPPQSWTNNSAANTLEHFGIGDHKFSGDQTDGTNSNGVSSTSQSRATSQINCAHCGNIGDTDKHFAKSNRKEFCSINCLKAATKKIYEVPSSSDTKKKNDTSQKLKEAVRKFASRLPDPDHEFQNKPQCDSSKSSITVEICPKPNSTSHPTPKQSHKLYKSKLVHPPKEPKVSPSLPPTYDWTLALESDPNFQAAHVSSFRLAPVRSLWENVQPGMKLEVENRDVNHCRTAFWVASVIKIQGYKVLLRFEGFGSDSSRDFWANLCTPEVHPVGWCATQNKPLIPPSSLTARYTDWRDFLVRRLTGARTIPQNFQDKIATALKSKYEVGTKLEVVDKNRISRVRLAEVIYSIGKRLHLIYNYENNFHADFWCHENSSLIHPCGWAQAVGQEISAPENYNPPSIESKMSSIYSHLHIQAGMKLEAIDPLNLSAICVATVKKVLKYDYIMVRVDCYEDDASGSDWFCYHLSSTSIFPCGFCASHGIPLTPPHGYTKESFQWNSYLELTKARPAPLEAIQKEPAAHNFSIGMRLEVADLMDPRLICVATISQIIGNLMKIHFDGWEEEYDQWLDAGSPDIYPLGWCELVGHKLEAPPVPQPQFAKKTAKTSKKAKKRPLPKRSGEKEPKLKKLKLSNTPHRITSPLHIFEKSKQEGRLASRAGPASESVTQPKQNYPKPNYLTSPAVSTKVGISTPKSRPVQECAAIKVQGEVKLETESTPPASAVMSRKVSDATGEKFIPKLVDSPPCLVEVEPQGWTMEDVSKFLMINDCGAYCDSFIRNKVDGAKFLSLAKESIIVLTGMKVGPAVKILDLISQLTRLVNAAKGKKLSPK